MKAPLFPILIPLVLSVAAGPRTMVTIIHPVSDGYVSPRETALHHKEIWVQGTSNIWSWIAFNIQGYTFSHTRTCMLCLNVTSVTRSGICDIHPIIAPVSAVKSRITRKTIHFDDIPLVSVPLDSSSAGQILFLNITDHAKAGSFQGVVIKARGTLDASFCASEGVLTPAIICTHDQGDSNAVSWFSGSDRPDVQTGKKGDFMVRTSRGTIYYKRAADWDSVGMITRPAAKKPAPSPGRRIAHRAKSPAPR